MKEAIVLLWLVLQAAPTWYDSNKEWLQGQVEQVKAKQVALHHAKPLYARLGVKPVIFTATAYEGSAISCGYWAKFHRTYTGMTPRRGIVAVDPRVIPFHTKLYIEGYGYGVAEDIGGAIKGNHIDVFIPSLREARKWGRKKVRVYILPKETSSKDTARVVRTVDDKQRPLVVE